MFCFPLKNQETGTGPQPSTMPNAKKRGSGSHEDRINKRYRALKQIESYNGAPEEEILPPRRGRDATNKLTYVHLGEQHKANLLSMARNDSQKNGAGNKESVAQLVTPLRTYKDTNIDPERSSKRDSPQIHAPKCSIDGMSFDERGNAHETLLSATSKEQVTAKNDTVTHTSPSELGFVVLQDMLISIVVCLVHHLVVDFVHQVRVILNCKKLHLI